jgi:hypothetical protein
MVLIRRVIAKNIHIESGAFLDHRQPNAPSANDRNRLTCNFIAQKRQIRMPESPLVFSCQVLRWPQLPSQRSQREKCKFGGGFG